MLPHTRAMIAAAAHALVRGGKVAGVYDHSSARHRRIAAEAQGEHLQGFDGDRSVRFGGTLPEWRDASAPGWIHMEIAGTAATGFDRATATFFTAEISDRSVQVYDHGLDAWFAFDMRIA